MMIEIVPGARPAELLPGRPEEVELLAARLARFAAGAADAVARLGRVVSEGWSGEAAELFREALGQIPAQLSRAGAAFSRASAALTGYASSLREAQAAVARAVRLIEQSTESSAEADRLVARQMIEQARASVADAGRAAAARLAEATTEAPAPGGWPGAGGDWTGLPAVRFGDLTVHAVASHELTDPDEFVAPMADVVGTLRFSVDHRVQFAGAHEASWRSWAAANPDRGAGQGPIGADGATSTAVRGALAALGLAGLTSLLRRRIVLREHTAVTLAGLTDDELRRRSAGRTDRGSRSRGISAPVRSSAARSGMAWRTHLAVAPTRRGTVQVWVGPEACPLPQARAAGSLSLPPTNSDVRGVVLRIGPPVDSSSGPGTLR